MPAVRLNQVANDRKAKTRAAGPPVARAFQAGRTVRAAAPACPARCLATSSTSKTIHCASRDSERRARWPYFTALSIRLKTTRRSATRSPRSAVPASSTVSSAHAPAARRSLDLAGDDLLELQQFLVGCARSGLARQHRIIQQVNHVDNIGNRALALGILRNLIDAQAQPRGEGAHSCEMPPSRAIRARTNCESLTCRRLNAVTSAWISGAAVRDFGSIAGGPAKSMRSTAAASRASGRVWRCMNTSATSAISVPSSPAPSPSGRPVTVDGQRAPP